MRESVTRRRRSSSTNTDSSRRPARGTPHCPNTKAFTWESIDAETDDSNSHSGALNEPGAALGSSLGQVHLRHHRATQETVGISERLGDLEVVVAFGDEDLHGFACCLHRRSEVA